MTLLDKTDQTYLMEVSNYRHRLPDDMEKRFTGLLGHREKINCSWIMK